MRHAARLCVAASNFVIAGFNLRGLLTADTIVMAVLLTVAVFIGLSVATILLCSREPPQTHNEAT